MQNAEELIAKLMRMLQSIFKKIFFKLINLFLRKWGTFVKKESPTLFIGIDVTHPAPGDTLSPSISALVGNIDLNATR